MAKKQSLFHQICMAIFVTEVFFSHVLADNGLDTSEKENNTIARDEDFTYLDWIIIISVFLTQITILKLFKQPLISRSGKIKLWGGDIHGTENSQQITDWYTFSHILHGVIFCAFTFKFLPFLAVKYKYFIALFTEVAWEIAENSPIVIKRYRQQALSQGYTGDSVLNSVCDALSMSFGFWLTMQLPGRVVLIGAIVTELFTLYMIRDNLLLNVIQLIHPVPAIAAWQAAGAPKAADKKDEAIEAATVLGKKKFNDDFADTEDKNHAKDN